MENAALNGGASDDRTPEQIEAEMRQTRESISEKVAALETQVLGTVQSAADTLTGTVDAVKSFVATAPETMKESVASATEAIKESFDISAKVKENPWVALGTAAAAGFAVGWLTASKSTSSIPATMAHSPVPSPAPVSFASAPAAPARPGPFDEILASITARIKTLAETALDTATAAATQSVKENVPKLIDAAAERLTPEPAPAHPAVRMNGAGRIYAGG